MRETGGVISASLDAGAESGSRGLRRAWSVTSQQRYGFSSVGSFPAARRCRRICQSQPGDGQHRETDRPGLRAADQRGRAIGATAMGVREPHVVRLPPVGLTIRPVPPCPPRRRSRRAGLVWIREGRRARPTALGAADPGSFPLLDMYVGRLGREVPGVCTTAPAEAVDWVVSASSAFSVADPLPVILTSRRASEAKARYIR